MVQVVWTSCESIKSVPSLIPGGVCSAFDDPPDISLVDMLPQRFPLLLSAEHEILDPAFSYLYYVGVISGKSRSTKTLSTYAEHLSDWFSFLEKNRRDWTEVDEEFLAHYRNKISTTPSRRTGEPLANETINARLGVICRFYRWHFIRGYIEELPFPEIAKSIPIATEYSKGQQGSYIENPLFLRHYKRFPRMLTQREIAAILSRCELPYGLMIRWAAVTGGRRSEIADLRLHQIPTSFRLNRNKQLLDIRIKRKGGHSGTLHVPLSLVHETNQYISIERQIARSHSSSHLRRKDIDHVFLTRLGTPVTPQRFSRVFRVAARASGIEAVLHHLRHTFAACMLQLLQEKANKGARINPLKTVQVMLGHRNISSTEIYLQVLRVHTREAEKALTYLYGKSA